MENHGLLICPLDGLLLHKQASCFVCESGHSFDIAKQGYVNLLPVQFKRSREPGDSREMIQARKRFLDSAAYEPIAQQVVEIITSQLSGDELTCLDAGCGEGYYLAYIRQCLEHQFPLLDVSTCGVDISKPAIVAAAKRDHQVTWVVASNKQLPVREHCIDIVLCMFGFPNFAAFKKVLKPGGKVILVDPDMNHLIELRELLYGQVTQKPALHHKAALAHGFTLIDDDKIDYLHHLNNQGQILDLAMMTPHYFKAANEARENLECLTTLDVTVDVSIKTFRL